MEEIPVDVCDGFEVTDIIEKMPTVNAISLDKVKQAREEIWKNVYEYSGTGDEVLQSYCDGFKASLQIIDKLIEEVE